MKKSNHISAYLTDETLKLLQEYALEHRWTLSTATSSILEDFLKSRNRMLSDPAKPEQKA